MGTMRKRLMLLAAALVLVLAQPLPALAAEEVSCEEICGELAAKNCKKIDSLRCTFYIAGCLSGCELGKILTR